MTKRKLALVAFSTILLAGMVMGCAGKESSTEHGSKCGSSMEKSSKCGSGKCGAEKKDSASKCGSK